MELPLCCVLNGVACDSRGGSYGNGCCGFKLCFPCTAKYRDQESEMYQTSRCNMIADLHFQFSATCRDVIDREQYKVTK